MRIVLPECGLGDALALTAAIREYHVSHPWEPVEVQAGPHAEVFRGNPHVTSDPNVKHRHEVKLETELHGNVGGIAVSFGIQLGIRVQDTTPELWGWKPEAIRPRFTVALDVGARAPSRLWVPERWDEVVSRLAEWDIDCVGVGRGVRMHGNLPAAPRMVKGLAEDLSGTHDSVHQAAGFLSSCDLFLGVDSGGAHLAAAAGIPQVVLYSRSPWYSRAYWNTTPVYWPELCNPGQCDRVCTAPAGVRCLDKIGALEVVRAVRLTLDRYPRRK